MRVSEIKTALEAAGLPVAYRMFPIGEAPALPWLVYYIGGEVNFPADGSNYHNIKQLTVELHTRLKDPDSEEAVENVLGGLGVWSKTEVYIETGKCYQIVYDLEV